MRDERQNVHQLPRSEGEAKGDRKGELKGDKVGEPEATPAPRRRGIYLAPNLITTMALFAGFFAIVAAVNNNFLGAALAIFAAMFADTLDGRVARWTKTESDFGAQYDSLSDMVAFGVAPAFVMFFWGLSTLGQIGWVASFVYMACAALRLARFNTSHDNSFFQGLASPSAAAIIASAVWLWHDFGLGKPTPIDAGVGASITILTGVLMVSNFSYYSPKLLNIRDRVPFLALVAVVLGVSVILTEPPLVLLILFTGYALSGPLRRLWESSRPVTGSGNLKDNDDSNS